MNLKLKVIVCFFLVFFGVNVHAAGWSNASYVENIYLTAQGSVIVKVTGKTNINNCSLIEGYQFVFNKEDDSKMFELFQTALVNNLKVKIYSKQCQSSAWVNVNNRVTFNQVSYVILSK